jgi:hypothetical protein
MLIGDVVHIPIEFFYVKHVHFVPETELVEIQMNGGCMAINDCSKLVINPINNPINCYNYASYLGSAVETQSSGRNAKQQNRDVRTPNETSEPSKATSMKR